MMKFIQGLILVLLFIFISGCGYNEEPPQLQNTVITPNQSEYNPPNQDDHQIEKENNFTEQLTQNQQAVEDTNCIGKNLFEYSPTNLDKIEFITPLGQMAAEHVLPTDHQYYYGKDEKAEIEIYSPAEGQVTFVQHMTSPVADPGAIREVDDYYILIEHACGKDSAFIHVDYPIKEIVDAVGDKDYVQIHLPVKAGQLVGTYTYSVDYNVFDKNAKTNFVDRSSYEGSRFLEVTDPFDYFSESIKTKMQEKSLRSVEPFGGKIDYDIDGKLVGNWFEVGTKHYQGLKLERYWAGHLSISYNNLDPNLIMISMGTYEPDKAMQFAVKGNSPDPAEIDQNSGIIKYELVDYQFYHNGESWDRLTYTKNLVGKPMQQAHGTLLVQMVEPRKIKLEVFPNKNGNQVNGFTSKAKFFER